MSVWCLNSQVSNCIDDFIAEELVPAAFLDARTSCCISVSSMSHRLPVAIVTSVGVSFDSSFSLHSIVMSSTCLLFDSHSDPCRLHLIPLHELRFPFILSYRPLHAGDVQLKGPLKPKGGCSSVQVFRCVGVHVFRCLSVSMFRCSGVPVFGVLGSRSRAQKRWGPNSRTLLSGPPGFHKTARELQTCTFEGPCA